MTAEAFYYPYTTIRSHESLKAMVLYFDTIYIMRPREVSIRDTSSISNEMDTLEAEGVIKYVSPSQLLSEYDDIMTKSVLSDIADPGFLKHSFRVPIRMLVFAPATLKYGFSDNIF